MAAQEGTKMLDSEREETTPQKPPAFAEKDAATRAKIKDMLARVGDKWSLALIKTLGERGPIRFNALQREMGDISQKMLSVTLRGLERDGFVVRTVTPSVPPEVSYALTDFGREFLVPVRTLIYWTWERMEVIETHRQRYDAAFKRPPRRAAPGEQPGAPGP